MLGGILLIWLLYVSLVLRFSWLPSMEDTLIPFAIGLLEFSMVDLMGPDTLGPWFLALAALFAICTGANHAVFVRARKDPANAYFFSKIPAASWRDFAASTTIVVMLILFSAALWITGNRSGMPLAGLIFGMSAMAYQFVLTHRYWMNTLLLQEDEKDKGPASR
jgi:predicted lysophospholipase L1 biosynthesis ABC-type transport system permease subunit